MMYEMTTDEAVDYVLGTEEDAATEPEDGKRIYMNRCRDCGQTFEAPSPGTRYCPACKRRRISDGMKKAAANDRQIKPEDPAQKAWDALGASETAANTPEAPPPERAPEDMTAGELVDALAAGMRREPGDVVLALYQAARDVARTSGIQTRVLIETMYELDCTLSHVGAV